MPCPLSLDAPSCSDPLSETERLELTCSANDCSADVKDRRFKPLGIQGLGGGGEGADD